MVEFNFKFALKSALGEGGISYDDIKLLKGKLSNAKDNLEKLRKDKVIGLYDIPEDKQMVEDIKNMGEKFFSNGIKTLVVFGMGGSSLGAIFLQNSLKQTIAQTVNKKMKVLFSENIDPAYLSDNIEKLNLDETLFCFVSKSGSTIEVVSQFFIIKEKLKNKFKDGYKEHMIFITDKKSGFLRNFADENNISVLNIAANVGGRYSIITAGSLFPAYCMGLNIDEFLKGIISARNDMLSKEPLDANPVYTAASVIYLYYTQKNRNMFLIDTYSDYLNEFGRWFRQLFAESLGKDLKSPTPIKATGATDQHSQLQLYMDGPQDKLSCFICLKDYGFDYNINSKGFEKYAYLNGKKLSELLLNELSGVELALAMKGRPSFRITLDKINEFTIGELSFICMEMVPILGNLLEINPFDQPGVEKGKKFAYLLMGRTDSSFASEMEELKRLQKIEDVAF
jgi:glucose-6-phosphate isomerase